MQTLSYGIRLTHPIYFDMMNYYVTDNFVQQFTQFICLKNRGCFVLPGSAQRSSAGADQRNVLDGAQDELEGVDATAVHQRQVHSTNG